MPQLTPVQVLTVQLDPRIEFPLELECERVGAPLRTKNLSTSTSSAAAAHDSWAVTHEAASGGTFAYFEVTIVKMPPGQKIAIGIVRRDARLRGYQLNCLPGLVRDSCGLESTGSVFQDGKMKVNVMMKRSRASAPETVSRLQRHFTVGSASASELAAAASHAAVRGKLFQEHDVVGCGFHEQSGTIIFTYNGSVIHEHISKQHRGGGVVFAPAIGLSHGCKVQVQLGDELSPFLFTVKSKNVVPGSLLHPLAALTRGSAGGDSHAQDSAADVTIKLVRFTFPGDPADDHTQRVAATRRASTTATGSSSSNSDRRLPPPLPPLRQEFLRAQPSSSDNVGEGIGSSPEQEHEATTNAANDSESNASHVTLTATPSSENLAETISKNKQQHSQNTARWLGNVKKDFKCLLRKSSLSCVVLVIRLR